MPIRPFEGIFPTIDPTAFVHPDAVVIGDVVIGAESSIWPGAIVRGDVNPIRIGARSNIQDGSVLHVNRATARYPNGVPLIIGDDVIVGHNVNLHACTLEHGCMIGIGAIVLDGAVIESGSMVGAGSLVAPHKRVAAGQLWMGSPAKALRDLTPEERESMRLTVESYRTLARRHAESLGS
ncbi:Protein YrdA [Candidatus Magnetaquicoccaceae bacterium FCR-1]|uniref:Protein YrdA n=1 Tax=Candidatus Magnetaquiglobus chichijimensis TaxID=3141448 RepID=A0ABQ0CCV4_9PROT